MYSVYGTDNNAWVGCAFAGVISLTINGRSWSQVFWSVSGSTSAHYEEQARSQLPADAIDPRYDADLAAWAAAHPGPGAGGPGGGR